MNCQLQGLHTPLSQNYIIQHLCTSDDTRKLTLAKQRVQNVAYLKVISLQKVNSSSFLEFNFSTQLLFQTQGKRRQKTKEACEPPEASAAHILLRCLLTALLRKKLVVLPTVLDLTQLMSRGLSMFVYTSQPRLAICRSILHNRQCAKSSLPRLVRGKPIHKLITPLTK